MYLSLSVGRIGSFIPGKAILLSCDGFCILQPKKAPFFSSLCPVACTGVTPRSIYGRDSLTNLESLRNFEFRLKSKVGILHLLHLTPNRQILAQVHQGADKTLYSHSHALESRYNPLKPFIKQTSRQTSLFPSHTLRWRASRVPINSKQFSLPSAAV